jgi:replicative DNA helicase
MEVLNTNTTNKRKIKPADSPTLAAAYARNKVHPEAIVLEEAVLGAVLLEKDALLTIIDVLRPESFYKEAHQHIFKACIALNNRNEPVDILTVTEELRKHNVLTEAGGPVYIAKLTSKISSSAHIEYHSRIIAEKYIQRELIKISSYIQDEAFESGTDAFDLLDKSQDSLFKLSEGNTNKQFETIKELVDKAVLEIKENANKKDGLTGVPSSFTELDSITGGWQKATLNIIAARPGHGKTAFALALARNAAVDWNIPTVFFSLEMDAVQLVMRLVSMETELESQNLKKGNLQMHEWTQLNKKVNALYESPLYIDDTPGLSISQFRAKTRRLKHEKNIQLIIIDYLQLMTVAEESKMVREQVISSISRTLKLVSKELQIPIIALAQVSRDMEKRGGTGGHKPMLSDLRESGAIEQDADMVMFVFRKEMFGMEFEEDGTPTKGTADIVIAKHRNGPTGDVRLKYINHLTKFVSMDGSYPQVPNNGGYEAPNSIKPNYNFDQNNGQTSRTIGSKMNDDDFMSGGSIEESPF